MKDSEYEIMESEPDEGIYIFFLICIVVLAVLVISSGGICIQ